jgi:hypothetical protein
MPLRLVRLAIGFGVIIAISPAACSSSSSPTQAATCGTSVAGVFSINMTQPVSQSGCENAMTVVLRVAADGTTQVLGAPKVATETANPNPNGDPLPGPAFSWSSCTAVDFRAGECPQVVSVVCAGTDAGLSYSAVFQLWIDAQGNVEVGGDDGGLRPSWSCFGLGGPQDPSIGSCPDNGVTSCIWYVDGTFTRTNE